MNQLFWVHMAIVLLIMSLFSSVGRVLWQNQRVLREVAWGTMLFSMIALIVAITTRSFQAQYFALSNMYESLVVLVIWVMGIFMVLDRRYQISSLAWPVALLLLATLGFATTLPTDIQPLQAALQSYWRSIHVPIIIFSYAMFTVAFLSSVVYLVKERFCVNKLPDKGSLISEAHTVLNYQTLNQTGSPQQQYSSVVEQSSIRSQPHFEARGYADRYGEPAFATESGARVNAESFSLLPPLYDEITYRCVSMGFPLLTIGIILGGLWANEAWGNYWSWDPKESMSLVTLLGYGVYLHMRVNGEHSPRMLAWVSVVCFVLLIVTYFGVNLMGLGLHSYGKIG